MGGQLLKRRICSEKEVLHLVLRPLRRRWPLSSKGCPNRSLQALQGVVDLTRLGRSHEYHLHDL